MHNTNAYTQYYRTSIYAAKVVDAFERPDMSMTSVLHEPRIAAGPMQGAAHADLKHCSGGTRSTFAAAHYYADAAKQRRDELLAQYKTSSPEESATTTAEE
jgi:hypothetical protein